MLIVLESIAQGLAINELDRQFWQNVRHQLRELSGVLAMTKVIPFQPNGRQHHLATDFGSHSFLTKPGDRVPKHEGEPDCVLIDNLVKGAAGQAVENFNRMNDLPLALGLEELEGQL